MATTPGRGSSVKRQDEAAGDEAVQVVRDQVEELARRGAQQMLLSALEEEVNHYLQRDRYQRQAEFRGYRNGTSPRRLTLGSGTVPLAVPRVRDIPPGQAPFESQILRKYQRRSDTIDETFMRLFIEGLATRDFEPALRLLAGAAAPLSPSTISRLTQQFRTAYTTFDRQDLSPWKFVYVWADGIYLPDGDGVTLREPERSESFLVCSNHYRKREQPQPGLACPRYATMLSKLREIAESRGKLHVSVDVAWQILESAPLEQLATYHRVVFEPNKRLMHVALPENGDPRSRGKVITLDVAKLLEGSGE
jgi:hypothetical protein